MSRFPTARSGWPTASAPWPDDETTPHLPQNGVAGLLPDLNIVREGFQRFGLLDDRVRFLQGPLTATLYDAPIERIALLRLGYGIGAETGPVLDELYDRLSVGGFVLVDDHGDTECAKAIDRFRSGPRDHRAPPADRRLGGRLAEGRGRAGEAGPEAGPGRHGAACPLAPPQPTHAIDLTVVVVFYNMRREAVRTLHSLSRAYQEGVADLDYEVIVVENGSAEDQRLGADLVEGFGPEFRYLDLGADAVPSPVHALNLGIQQGRGRAYALMIDGAHVLSPGVLRYGAMGLAAYAPAIVATQQWYVGPGQQGEAMDDGYDQAYEDRLFDSVGWPNAGYRIFEISHFIGDRDWLDGTVGEQLPVRRPRTAGAGRCVRRVVLGRRRWLRQPGALRAARHRPEHDGGDDPRGGLVPPGPRGHHHQPARRLRAPGAGVRVQPGVRRAARSRVPRARQAAFVRRQDRVAGGPEVQAPPALVDGVLGERIARRCRRAT